MASKCKRLHKHAFYGAVFEFFFLYCVLGMPGIVVVTGVVVAAEVEVGAEVEVHGMDSDPAGVAEAAAEAVAGAAVAVSEAVASAAVDEEVTLVQI